MKKILFSILVLFTWIASVQAQSADVFFHDAAKYYCANDFKKAKAAIREGLWKNPNDEKLKALLKKIVKKEQENQKKEQQKKEQEQKDKKKQEQQQKEQQQKQQQQQKEQQDKKQQQQQEQQKKEQQKQEQQKKAEQAAGAKKDDKKKGAQGVTANKYKKEEADRLLMALRAREQKTKNNLDKRKQLSTSRQSDKDW